MHRSGNRCKRARSKWNDLAVATKETSLRDTTRRVVKMRASTNSSKSETSLSADANGTRQHTCSKTKTSRGFTESVFCEHLVFFEIHQSICVAAELGSDLRKFSHSDNDEN